MHRLSVISWLQEPRTEPGNHVVLPDARCHVKRDKSVLLAPGNEHAGMPVLLDHHLAASLHAAATTATATAAAGPTASSARDTTKLSVASLLTGEIGGAAVLCCCLASNVLCCCCGQRLLPLSDLRQGHPSQQKSGSSCLKVDLLCCDLLQPV